MEIQMPEDLQLSNSEKELVRCEFISNFGEPQSVTNGFLIKRWATGPKKGQPKLKTAMRGMLDRGLVTLVDEGYWPRAMLTEKGFKALKRLAAEPRGLDPDRHRFLIDELRQIPD